MGLLKCSGITVSNKSTTRRDFLRIVAAGAASLALPGCVSRSNVSGQAYSGDKPNIILIMADDLGYGDVGCYGNEIVKTPNIDWLARNGMRFTDFHSNGPMCSPTRAALLTGRYQQRAGIETVLGYLRDKKIGAATTEVTFAEVLKKSGYAVGIFGKWHTGHLPEYGPIRQGFDTFRGCYGGLDYHSHVNRIGRENWWKDEELVPEEGYVTELITAHAERFIEQHKERPFCLYVPHFGVHFPWQGPSDKADFLPGIDNASVQKKYGSRTDRMKAYSEMIEALDDSVGRIVDTVRALGLEQKTLILFMSDNGGHEIVASNAPLAGYKGSLLEGGHRVPAIAYWPGKIKAGTVTEQTAMTMDVFATMVAATGSELPDGLKLDGVNLLGLLLEEKTLPERSLFWRHQKQKVIRKGPWKLLIQGANCHLYNLSDDIGEKNDLAAARPGMVKAMETEFLAWEADVTAGVTWVKK